MAGPSAYTGRVGKFSVRVFQNGCRSDGGTDVQANGTGSITTTQVGT